MRIREFHDEALPPEGAKTREFTEKGSGLYAKA